MRDHSYTIDLVCTNCGFRPFLTADDSLENMLDFIKETDCPNCKQRFLSTETDK